MLSHEELAATLEQLCASNRGLEAAVAALQARLQVLEGRRQTHSPYSLAEVREDIVTIEERIAQAEEAKAASIGSNGLIRLHDLRIQLLRDDLVNLRQEEAEFGASRGQEEAEVAP